MTDQLFSSDDLSHKLARPVDADAATMAERVAWGLLSAATGLTTRPDPVTDDWFAWAIELGAMAYVNPDGAAQKTAGPFTRINDAKARDAILAAASAASDGGGASNGPRGNFPCAQPWPDPQWAGTGAR